MRNITEYEVKLGQSILLTLLGIIVILSFINRNITINHLESNENLEIWQTKSALAESMIASGADIDRVNCLLLNDGSTRKSELCQVLNEQSKYNQVLEELRLIRKQLEQSNTPTQKPKSELSLRQLPTCSFSGNLPPIDCLVGGAWMSSLKEKEEKPASASVTIKRSTTIK